MDNVLDDDLFRVLDKYLVYGFQTMTVPLFSRSQFGESRSRLQTDNLLEFDVNFVMGDQLVGSQKRGSD